MKNLATLLLTALLCMGCFWSTSFLVSTRGETQPLYAVSKHIDAHELDFWRISNVNNGETLLVLISASTTYPWTSRLYYSNSTPVPGEDIYQDDAHSHVWLVDKTDNYTLIMDSESNSFCYTIRYSHGLARVKTQIGSVMNPNPALLGQTVNLLGRLTEFTSNQPILGQTILLLVNGIPQSGTLTTNATGWFKGSGQVKSVGAFNVTVVYEGSSQYLPSSNWTILVVKTQTWLYAVFIPNPVNAGEPCELRGVLVDQFGNPVKFATVSLEYSTDYGFSWNPAGTLTTNVYGVFSKAFMAPSTGTYLVRIKYPGSPSHLSSTVTTALIVR